MSASRGPSTSSWAIMSVRWHSGRGWATVKNGELLRLAETEFDLFITADQNLQYQQNLAGCRIAILELSTNKLRRIVAAAPLLQAAVATIKSGEYRCLEIPYSLTHS